MSDGPTVLDGFVIDQAALHGVRRKLAHLGLPLLSVTRLPPARPPPPPPPAADHPQLPTPRETVMTTAVPATSSTGRTETRTSDGAPRRRMDPMRKVALAGGITYLITFAASIPQLALFADIVEDPTGYITSPGSNTAVLWGSWLEVVTAAACVGTAVALYPATRRVSRTAAIGFVTSRVVEATLIVVGVMSLLAVVTLQHRFAGATGAQADALGVTGEALVAMRQWTFLLGPGLVPGVNALLLGYVMYRARLVPRAIPAIGFVGAPLLLASATGTIFGAWDQVSAAGAAGALPIAVWEFSLGVYLTFKGFKTTPGATTDV